MEFKGFNLSLLMKMVAYMEHKGMETIMEL